jgi:hypothetical protein
MSLFDNVQNGISTVQSAAGKVSSVLKDLSNPAQVLSNLRKINVPTGPGGAAQASRVRFGGPGNFDDWRVRLSLPDNFIGKSPILQPLVNAGGLVFPYTPSINIAHSANYDTTSLLHQNYDVLSYQSSKIDSFTITGEFYVEDYVQAQYWLAALHFLRTVTKMYTGDDTGGFQGSPPPILSFNGYGDYVFKNVPVIVKSFTLDLPKDVDYISTDMSAPEYSVGSNSAGAAAATGAAGAGVAGTLQQVAGIAGAVGAASAAKSLGTAAAAIGVAAGVAGMLSNLGGGAGGSTTASALNSGSPGVAIKGTNHVPTKSTISVTIAPVYSRTAMRTFSLQQFVNGGYIGGTGGFI